MLKDLAYDALCKQFLSNAMVFFVSGPATRYVTIHPSGLWRWSFSAKTPQDRQVLSPRSQFLAEVCFASRVIDRGLCRFDSFTLGLGTRLCCPSLEGRVFCAASTTRVRFECPRSVCRDERVPAIVVDKGELEALSRLLWERIGSWETSSQGCHQRGVRQGDVRTMHCGPSPQRQPRISIRRHAQDLQTHSLQCLSRESGAHLICVCVREGVGVWPAGVRNRCCCEAEAIPGTVGSKARVLPPRLPRAGAGRTGAKRMGNSQSSAAELCLPCPRGLL